MIKNFTQSTKCFLISVISLSAIIPNCAFAQSAKWQNIFSGKQSTNFYSIEKSFEKQEKKWQKIDRKKRKRGEAVAEHAGEEVYKRWASYMAPRVYPSGNILLPSNTYNNFFQWQSTNPTAAANKKTRAGNWTLLNPAGSPSGPSPYSRTGAGRINFVRFDPTNLTTMFVGAPDGGLWKSTNNGASWATNTDFLSVIGCSDLAIDPNNTQIMYLATGDIESDRRSVGILKTTDGGVTWNPTALVWTAIDDYKISKLIMNPTNPLSMIAATNGGTFKTQDGWLSYTQGNFPGGALPNLQDMEVNPKDTSTIYAAGNQLFKSTDNGDNWIEITAGLPAADIGRIALGVTPADSSYVYALIGKSSNSSFLGIYRSTDFGTTFDLRADAPNILGYEIDGSDDAGQAFYDLAIAVSPTNAELITTGGVNHWQSADGGVTLVNKSVWDDGEVHADIHEISYLPGSNSVLFSCNDGGIFRSIDNGDNFTDISNNLTIGQVVGIGLSSTMASTYLVGTQDNGTNQRKGMAWENVSGGDGGDCIIDPTNNNIIYMQYVEGAYSRSDDGGITSVGITNGFPVDADGKIIGFDFYSNWIMNPLDPKILYTGGHETLYRTNNRGDLWNAEGTPTGTGSIKGLAIAASDTGIIYAIKTDAVSKSIDGGATFTDITNNLPVANAAPASITVSNTNPLKVWVVFSGYSAPDKVYKSVDGGNNWIDISAGLPNLPINTIVYRNNSPRDIIYIGADIGVYYRDSTSGWIPFSTDLPNVAIRDLEIFYPSGKIRAGTYGRGVWESALHINIPLSISFNNFSAQTIDQQNVLSWTVSQDANLNQYNVQRSADGNTFEKIGTIIASKSSSKISYDYTDSNPIDGKNYYRLEMIDENNDIKNSSVIELINQSNTIGIYPNPANDVVTIELPNKQFDLQLIDESGKVIFRNINAKNKILINTMNFTNGIYTLEIKFANGIVETHKINILH
jgi:photosystem II stability/assembly factor-like uncharacterized protein